MCMKNFIAIDPGFSGGIVFSSGNKIEVFKMPENPMMLLGLLRDIFSRGVDIAAVENVGTYRPGNSGPAAVTFAKHIGHLEMGILSMPGNFELLKPVPQTWMKVFPGAPKGIEKKTERKNFIKSSVQALFPSVKVTLWNSDALGILYWSQGYGF